MSSIHVCRGGSGPIGVDMGGGFGQRPFAVHRGGGGGGGSHTLLRRKEGRTANPGKWDLRQRGPLILGQV